MPTTIASIKVNKIRIEEKEGTLEVVGNYSLISNKGKVLAVQGFNEYNEIKVEVPQEALRQILREVEKAVTLTIGLEED